MEWRLFAAASKQEEISAHTRKKNTYTQTEVKTAFSLLSKTNGKNKSSNRPVWFRTIFENASENKGEASISATPWWMGLFNGNWLINNPLGGRKPSDWGAKKREGYRWRMWRMVPVLFARKSGKWPSGKTVFRGPV